MNAVIVVAVVVAVACMIRSLAATGFRAALWALLCLVGVFSGLVASNHTGTAAAARTDENSGQSGGFPVVAVGDSILAYVHPNLWPASWHIDAQGARNPYDPPPATIDGTTPTSTHDAIGANVPLVAPGGVFILQDVTGPLDRGAWHDLIAGAVAALPDDRCLIVITGYYPADHGNAADEQNRVLVDVAAEQPCHRVVGWADAVAADPHAMLDPDGIHPSIAGDVWLVQALALTVMNALTVADVA